MLTHLDRRVPALVVIACVAATVAGLRAQTPQWRAVGSPIAAPGPGAMAYDDLRDRTVFFGGGSGYSPFSFLFELDGDAWTAVMPRAPWPTPRFWPAAVYDSRRGEVVMYGGADLGPTYFTDTWRWNGTTWTQAFPAQSPPAMVGHAMSYDEGRDRIVLFGTSTWEWDGTNWLPRHSSASPSPRTSPAMTYDARRARTVLFGGYQSTTSYFDTWEWDGTDWTLVATTGVQPTVFTPNLAFDRERDRSLLIGQQTGGTWGAFEFDGSSWSVAATPPGVAAGGSLVYDRQRGRLVYLATDRPVPNTGVTWVYDTPGLAVAQPYGVACGAPALRARTDPTARPVLGGTLGVDILDVPAGAAFLCFGWSNRQVLNLQLPASMEGFGLPGCWILQSDDAITLPCVPTGPTTARFSMAIPAQASFTGLRFFLQPWAPAPGAFPPVDAVVGNGVAVTIGAF